jgi:ABC-2 type transport system ATP-binding protein
MGQLVSNNHGFCRPRVVLAVEEEKKSASTRKRDSRSGKVRNLALQSPNGVSTDNLTKAYGNFRAVDSLSINVDGGEIFGFLGPNGAGKTSTIRMLCGLIYPTSGRATVAGFDIRRESSKIKEIVGLLPESGGYYNWMNAEEYLVHFGALYRIERGEAKERSEELLERVGLAEKSFAPIGYYSRGMKQRLGLARALINKPRIVFLDEPTLGLDPKGQQDIKNMLLELHKDGVTVFLSSHMLSEVSALCNRISIVNRGRLVAQGTIEELRQLAGNSVALVFRVFNSDAARERLSHLPFQVTETNENKFLDVIIPESSESVTKLIHTFEGAGVEICEIHRNEMSLEQVFFNLTATDQGL